MVAVISIVAFKYARSLDKALNFALFWFVACYVFSKMYDGQYT